MTRVVPFDFPGLAAAALLVPESGPAQNDPLIGVCKMNLAKSNCLPAEGPRIGDMSVLGGP
jgi:hypothetical protein